MIFLHFQLLPLAHTNGIQTDKRGHILTLGRILVYRAGICRSDTYVFVFFHDDN
jgi:hypothetical protein